MSNINAGDLRHRVTWQSSVELPDAAGQFVATWTAVGTYWARVEPLSGRELVNAKQIKATTSHRITMRNVGPIKPTDRLIFEGTGRVFNVDSATRADEQNQYFHLMATELDPA